MRKNKYIGTFRSSNGHEYSFETTAWSFFEAFFLLTADAIRNGSHYQLYKITQEGSADFVLVDDIMKINKILSLNIA